MNKFRNLNQMEKIRLSIYLSTTKHSALKNHKAPRADAQKPRTQTNFDRNFNFELQTIKKTFLVTLK